MESQTPKSINSLMQDLPLDKTVYLDYTIERVTIKESNHIDDPVYVEW